MTKEQKLIIPVPDALMERLKKIISSSLKLNDFVKQTLIWMLEQTENLSKEVFLSFLPRHKDIGEAVAFGVDDVCCGSADSSGVNHLLKEMGISMMFSSCEGYYVENYFDPSYSGFTIWISSKEYDHGATKLPLDLEAIKAVKL